MQGVSSLRNRSPGFKEGIGVVLAATALGRVQTPPFLLRCCNDLKVRHCGVKFGHRRVCRIIWKTFLESRRRGKYARRNARSRVQRLHGTDEFPAGHRTKVDSLRLTEGVSQRQTRALMSRPYFGTIWLDSVQRAMMPGCRKTVHTSEVQHLGNQGVCHAMLCLPAKEGSAKFESCEPSRVAPRHALFDTTWQITFDS